MPTYPIYNQLISTIIMVKQDVPNLPLPIINVLTSMPRAGMLQVILGGDNHLNRFLKVHPTKLVLILRNKVYLLSIWLIVSPHLLWRMVSIIVLVITITH